MIATIIHSEPPCADASLGAVTDGSGVTVGSAAGSDTGADGSPAGAVEAVFTAMALKDAFLPATIHYQTPDPECDLDVVPNTGRHAEIRYAMSNSLGFGGHNGSILLKKWEEPAC